MPGNITSFFANTKDGAQAQKLITEIEVKERKINGLITRQTRYVNQFWTCLNALNAGGASERIESLKQGIAKAELREIPILNKVVALEKEQSKYVKDLGILCKENGVTLQDLGIAPDQDRIDAEGNFSSRFS